MFSAQDMDAYFEVASNFFDGNCMILYVYDEGPDVVTHLASASCGLEYEGAVCDCPHYAC